MKKVAPIFWFIKFNISLKVYSPLRAVGLYKNFEKVISFPTQFEKYFHKVFNSLWQIGLLIILVNSPKLATIPFAK